MSENGGRSTFISDNGQPVFNKNICRNDKITAMLFHNFPPAGYFFLLISFQKYKLPRIRKTISNNQVKSPKKLQTPQKPPPIIP